MQRKQLATNETLIIPRNSGAFISLALHSGNVNIALDRAPTTSDPKLTDIIPTATLNMTIPPYRDAAIHIKATTASDIQWMVV